MSSYKQKFVVERGHYGVTGEISIDGAMTKRQIKKAKSRARKELVKKIDVQIEKDIIEAQAKADQKRKELEADSVRRVDMLLAKNKNQGLSLVAE